jgi:hypothetical protein
MHLAYKVRQPLFVRQQSGPVGWSQSQEADHLQGSLGTHVLWVNSIGNIIVGVLAETIVMSSGNIKNTSKVNVRAKREVSE